MVGLGLGVGLGIGGNRSAGGKPIGDAICRAIARKVCITAADEDRTLKLAPHVVYKRGRREIPTLDAVHLERDGKPVNRPTMRTYAIEVLSDIRVTEDGLTVFAGFDSEDSEYTGRSVCIVQPI